MDRYSYWGNQHLYTSTSRLYRRLDNEYVQRISVDAYSSMRHGVLYLFVSWVIIAMAFAIAIASSEVTPLRLATPIGRTSDRIPPIARGLTNVVFLMMVFLIAITISAVIALVRLWGRFIPGVNRLASANPEFSIANLN